MSLIPSSFAKVPPLCSPLPLVLPLSDTFFAFLKTWIFHIIFNYLGKSFNKKVLSVGTTVSTLCSSLDNPVPSSLFSLTCNSLLHLLMQVLAEKFLSLWFWKWFYFAFTCKLLFTFIYLCVFMCVQQFLMILRSSAQIAIFKSIYFNTVQLKLLPIYLELKNVVESILFL